jgi:hypothetical protein
MTEIPMRTMDEVELRYTLEPSLRDVYVEGESDSSLMEWYFQECGIDSVSIICSRDVEVDVSQVLKLGCEDNNRGRLLYIAKYIKDHVPHFCAGLTFILDLDLQTYLPIDCECQYVRYTDFCCMQAYLFEESIFRKFIGIGCNRKQTPVNTLMDSISDCIQVLFAGRLANKKLGWGLKAVGFCKCLQLHNYKLSLSFDEYWNRYLSSNRRLSSKPQFIETVNIFKNKFGSEKRMQMNGHDLMDCIAWVVRQLGSRSQIAHPLNIYRSLLLCINVSYLAKYSLFKELQTKYA